MINTEIIDRKRLLGTVTMDEIKDILKELENKFSNSVIKEFEYYLQYLKYTKAGKISSGNRNWLIVDSCSNHSRELCEYIRKINNANYIITNCIDDSISIYRSKFDDFLENKFLGDIEYGSDTSNILLVSRYDFDVAFNKYGDKATFYIDLNKDFLNANQSQKEEKVKQFLKQNDFTLEQNELLQDLACFKNADNILTRAILKCKDRNSKVITKEDIGIFNSNANELINELNSLVGLEKTKKTITEIINYLNVANRRNDMPVLNMAFLGNPRNW